MNPALCNRCEGSCIGLRAHTLSSNFQLFAETCKQIGQQQLNSKSWQWLLNLLKYVQRRGPRAGILQGGFYEFRFLVFFPLPYWFHPSSTMLLIFVTGKIQYVSSLSKFALPISFISNCCEAKQIPRSFEMKSIWNLKESKAKDEGIMQ